MAISSTSSAVATKPVAPAAELSDTQLIRKITETLLNQYFPDMAARPNALPWLLGTWFRESSFQLTFRNSTTTRHSSDNPGTRIRSRYDDSNTITNLVATHPSPTILANIADGYYAHGLTGVIGTYFIATDAEDSKYFNTYSSGASLAAAQGLRIAAGQSVQNLFINGPTKEVGYTRSIAAGIIIFYNKFKESTGANSQKYRDLLSSKFNGLQYDPIVDAAGRYVGAPSAKADANGVGYYQRIQSVNEYLARTGGTGMIASSSSNDQTRVATTSNDPAAVTGCKKA